MVPVAPVAGEARGLQTVDGAHFAGADQGDELLEARAHGQSRSRTAEIVVDYADGGKAGRLGGLDQGVLPPLALEVADHLRQGRLADIDDGRAAEMVRRDLRVHRRPPWLRLWSFGLGSAERGPRGEGRPAPAEASAPRSSWGAVPAPARGQTVVGWGWGVAVVSYGRSSVTGELDDEGKGCLSTRPANTSVRSMRAAMATAGGPGVMVAHATSSHIQAGSSRRTPMRSSTSRRSAAPRVVRCPTRRRRP